MKKSNIIILGIFILLCINILFVSCKEKVTKEHALCGQITDELGSPISNVSVLLQNASTNLTTKTDIEGNYRFENLEINSYNVTFSKEGFATETEELNIEWGRTSKCDFRMINTMGVLIGGEASIVITDYLAISDGIYLWVKMSENTQKFYIDDYKIDISNWSDVEIIAHLIVDGLEGTKEDDAFYNWDLLPNTNYTYCIVAMDKQGRINSYEKRTISTKSTVDQPLAEISISNISGGTVFYSQIKNSFCFRFLSAIRWGAIEHIYKPDIWWAGDLYECRHSSGYIIDNNIINSNWTPPTQGWCALYTLGITSNEVYNGLSKKIFNTITGEILKAPPLQHGNNKKGKTGYRALRRKTSEHFQEVDKNGGL